MRKRILLVYPYKFTNFEFYKYEIKKFKYEVIILDLSNCNKNFTKNSWKSSRYNGVISPTNIKELFFFFKNLDKKNLFVLNFCEEEKNLWVFFVKYFIKKFNLNEIQLEERIWSFNNLKNFSWLFEKFKFHLLNLKIYFFYFKKYFYSFLYKFLNHNKKYYMTSNNKKFNYIHNYDYSNSLDFKVNLHQHKRYILYLDNGGPYFTGDTLHKGNKLPTYNIDKTYKDYINFFKKLEFDLNCKLIVIPHPKYKSSIKKIKTFNPYFKNFIVDNRPDAIKQRISETFLFLSKGSLASSYAVIFKKPIIFFYSSQHIYENNEFKAIKEHAHQLGNKAFDITNYKKNFFKTFLKINYEKYSSYLNTYLAPNKKFSKMQNFELISNFIEKISIDN